MKFYTLAALAASSAVVAKKPLFEAPEKEEVVPVERTIEDQLEAFKHFYDGFYKSFYHASSRDETLKTCMDETTIANMITLGGIVKDPLSMFELKNIKSDLNLFGAAAEVTSDLAQCHFEHPFFDLWGMCKEDETTCAIDTLTQNLTKNMFVLVGKMTQMGESMTEMKGADQAEYEEIMKEMGTDCGTMLRDVFAFEGKAPSEQ